jgi:hypothetical protein
VREGVVAVETREKATSSQKKREKATSSQKKREKATSILAAP